MTKSFTEIGTSIGQLVEEKNKAYGNAFAESCKILEVLFPNGVPVEKYTDLLTITRILDKLFRIATDKDALGESPFGDIAGYAILALKRQEDHKGTVGLWECRHCKKPYEGSLSDVNLRTGLCPRCEPLTEGGK